MSVFFGAWCTTLWLVAAETISYGVGKRREELRTRFIKKFFHLETLNLKLFFASTSNGFVLTCYECDLCLVHQVKLPAGKHSFGEF